MVRQCVPPRGRAQSIVSTTLTQSTANFTVDLPPYMFVPSMNTSGRNCAADDAKLLGVHCIDSLSCTPLWSTLGSAEGYRGSLDLLRTRVNQEHVAPGMMSDN